MITQSSNVASGKMSVSYPHRPLGLDTWWEGLGSDVKCMESGLNYKQRYPWVTQRVQTSVSDHAKTRGSHEEGNGAGLNMVSPSCLALVTENKWSGFSRRYNFWNKDVPWVSLHSFSSVVLLALNYFILKLQCWINVHFISYYLMEKYWSFWLCLCFWMYFSRI